MMRAYSVNKIMTWQELRNGVYEVDGSWRDLCVLDASREDWARWIAFVNQHYPVKWAAEDYQDGETLAAIEAEYIDQRWDAGAEALTTWGSVFLEKVQVNCHFFQDSEIENDIDPSEVVSMEDHDRLMTYAVAISTILGKEVVITAESFHEGVYIRINGANIQFI
jgi:hypothetical protein